MDNVKLLRDQKEKIVSNQENIDEEINDESDKPEFWQALPNFFHSKIDGGNKSDDKQTVNEDISKDKGGNDDVGSFEGDKHVFIRNKIGVLDKDDDQHVDTEEDPYKLGEDVDVKNINIEESKTGLGHGKDVVKDAQGQDQVDTE